MPRPEDAAADPAIGRRGAYAKGVARRQEILDRAIEVFRERGPGGTTLRRIAENLGISHAALLHYFDSREQLLVAVYEHHERRRAETDAVPPSSEPGPVGDMVSAATANLSVPGLVALYTTLVATALQDDSIDARAFFTQRFARIREDLTTRVQDDQQAGRIRDDVDAATIAALIVAASDGVQVQWLLDPSVPLQDTLGALAVLLQPAPGA